MDTTLSPAVEAEQIADSTIDTVSRLIAGVFSGALTGIFAMGINMFCRFDHLLFVHLSRGKFSLL